jgi:phasin family protein
MNKKKENNMFNNYNPFEMLDFQKILTAAKLPNVDMNSDVVISSQKKTMEALAAASKAVFEGVNAFSKKQVEILNAAVNEVKEATSELAKGNTQQSATKSIELAKEAIEKAQANVAELAKINEKTAKESFQILNARFLDSLTELKNVVAEQAEKKAPAKN